MIKGIGEIASASESGKERDTERLRTSPYSRVFHCRSQDQSMSSDSAADAGRPSPATMESSR